MISTLILCLIFYMRKRIPKYDLSETSMIFDGFNFFVITFDYNIVKTSKILSLYLEKNYTFLNVIYITGK